MKMIRNIVILLCIFCISCDKSNFLSQKPNQSDVVPTTLSELQAVLDQDRDMNGMGTSGRGPVPNLGEIGSDDYYVTENTYNSILKAQTQNYYRWSPNPYEDVEVYSWRWPYLSVFSANVVLDQLKQIERNVANQATYDYIKGSALFFRAHAYYQLAQVFVPPYQAESAASSMGLPIRLTADFSVANKWSTIEETYQLIIDDLLLSAELMGDTNRHLKTRPNGQASLALMARVYLSMREYKKAQEYAEYALDNGDMLLSYSVLDPSSAYPFSELSLDNPEIIFACNIVGSRGANYPIKNTIAAVDTGLLEMYETGDLRRLVFYGSNPDGTAFFKGSYNGDDFFFTGLSTAELYLILAECYARDGRVAESLEYLNELRTNRWSADTTFEALTTADSETALQFILDERRRELVFRGIRWTDLRRLNLEGYNIVLQRIINGESIVLQPNDPRYTWALPNEVTAFR